jgi:hypothetical protein
MDKSPPPLAESISQIVAAIPLWLEDLSHHGWRPSRVFPGKLEPIASYHRRLADLYDRSLYGKQDDLRELLSKLMLACLDQVDRYPKLPIAVGLADLIIGLVDQNGLARDFPKIDPALASDPAYSLPLRRQLAEIEPLLVHEQRIRATFAGTAATFVIGIIEEDLPEDAFGLEIEEAKSTFTVPLLSHMRDPRMCVAKIVAQFVKDVDNNDPAVALPFAATRQQILLNVLAASHLSPEQVRANPAKIILPEASDLPPMQLAETYLAHTPFLNFVRLSVPFTIPHAYRFEHCHIIGGTGHGKTQLIQALALSDIDDPARPGVVIIDSQGAMLKTLSRLARFDPALDDRLLIVDPADTEFPLCLNVFDIHKERIDRLSLGEREQILAGIIELYDYLFGAISAELTQKQSVIFRYLARLMLDIPGANIQTLRELMEDTAPFQPYIDRLTGTTRAFFKNEFADRSFNATKQQIRRRLYGILSNPTFERMFSNPRNKLDIKTALDAGKIVLVNTAKDVLKAEASSFFGRYVIALVMQAAFERAAQKEQNRRPAFLYIDEAADYFDDNIDTLLIQARKFNLGVTLAHQFLDQLEPGLRSSVMTNPAIRFAGGVSQKDANALDSDMRTSNDVLMATRKRKTTTEFACYVRNLTPAAVTLQVPLGLAENEPRMTDDAHAALRERSRALLAEPLRLPEAHSERGIVPAPAVPAPTSVALTLPRHDPSKTTEGW